MKTKIGPHISAVAIAVALFFAVALLAHAATITVTNTNDSGAGSLRQALIDTSDGDTITFAVTGTVVLTSGNLLVDKNVTIEGPGAASLAVNGNATYGFYIYANVAISGLTITNGGILNEGGLTLSNCTISAGGGISSCYSLEINNCTISGNSSAGIIGGLSTLISNSAVSGNSGAGIALGPSCGEVFAELQITNSTISGNAGGGIQSSGGGYDSGSSARLEVNTCTISGNADVGISNAGSSRNRAEAVITNSTISDNSAPDAGGIYNYDGIISIGNTVLKAGAVGANISNNGSLGVIYSLGYNLSSDNGDGVLTGPGDQINTDPMLGPLQDNGGPTFTHELLIGSPAIDAGDTSFYPGPYYDQRGPGYYRVMNGRMDIGAFEVQSGPPPSPTPTPTASPTPTPTATATATPTPTPTPTSTPTPTPTPTPPDVITLTASIGPKFHGNNTVNLSWTGANVPFIDILRNGALLGTTQNTGSYTDYFPPNQRGTYTYKVCETGTSICSNEATVTFRR
jgi:hypothetical protein